jgi:osmotically-inducible protein OsmY
MKITLSNGLTVERSGKNSELKVTDESGKRGGQTLLNEFISTFALDLPRFMDSTPKEKANVLLQIIGVGDKLREFDDTESKLYNKRYEIGRIAEQKAKFAAELPFYEDAPTAPISVSELIRQQQEILARNGLNQKKRQEAAQLAQKAEAQKQRLAMLSDQINALTEQHRQLYEEYAGTEEALEAARKTAGELMDESTAELESSIANAEEINRKVRSNEDREKAMIEAEGYKTEYNTLSESIEKIRSDRRALLDGADLPLKGLSVENGELTYNGQKWDCMSGSEQLKAAAAIVRRLNPECGFVLIDKLEQMDTDTLREFGEWTEREGLQVIATRVSTGDECTIIITDGYAEKPASLMNTEWKAGVF